MRASKMNPIYTTYIISNETGTKYNLTPAVKSLDFSDQKKQMAQSVNIEVMNTKVGSQWLTDILKVRDRVFIYANDGSRSDEVFRGYVWTRPYRSGLTEREITLKCYDDLIYFQESEEAEYFSPGKSTEDVISALCSKWGVSLNYQYENITHAKLALRGTLSDIITSDVLGLVKERTNKEYVILSEKGKMTIKGLGQNSTIYQFRAKSNAVRTNSECTMNGMVTKVVILGKAEDGQDREPVEATVEGDTDKYGTLQKIMNRDQNTSLADAKKEAESIIKKDGTPKWEYELRAPDVPWIRKGDKVFVSAGDIKNRYLIVTGVDRSIKNDAKEITLSLEEVGGETLNGRMQQTAGANFKTSIELGTINGDLSLTTDSIKTPIPKGEYMISLALTHDTYYTYNELNSSAGAPHVHNGGEHEGHTSGTGFHTHNDGLHDHRVPSVFRGLQAGDRVLVAWAGHEPIVVDIVVSSNETNSN